MIKDAQVAIVNAASLALKIYKKVPDMPIEEIIKKIIPFLEAEKVEETAEIAAISAVNGVVKLKKRPENKDITDRKASCRERV